MTVGNGLTNNTRNTRIRSFTTKGLLWLQLPLDHGLLDSSTAPLQWWIPFVQFKQIQILFMFSRYFTIRSRVQNSLLGQIARSLIEQFPSRNAPILGNGTPIDCSTCHLGLAWSGTCTGSTGPTCITLTWIKPNILKELLESCIRFPSFEARLSVCSRSWP